MMYSQQPLPIQSQSQQAGMIKINPQQFRQWLPQLNDNIISQLKQQARSQGISEKDIEEGLNFINFLRGGQL